MDYVEMRNGGYYVKGKQICLDVIVYCWRDGDPPETIQRKFPSLTLEEVYGAITFYLAHRVKVDANIREGEEIVFRKVPPLSESDPDIYQRWLAFAERETPTRP